MCVNVCVFITYYIPDTVISTRCTKIGFLPSRNLYFNMTLGQEIVEIMIHVLRTIIDTVWGVVKVQKKGV